MNDDRTPHFGWFSPHFGWFSSMQYRVRRHSSTDWSPWKTATTVTQGLGWVEFDGERFDSSWAWEITFERLAATEGR